MRLMDEEPAIVERAFGVPSGEPRRLADLILVDNDVRCVARHYLSQHNWANFACVYVGSGVGAGMVVDGRVYYGSNGSAGHIGHIGATSLASPSECWPCSKITRTSTATSSRC
jgi:predicted NBD/HSP70 family sugar kinase